MFMPACLMLLLLCLNHALAMPLLRITTEQMPPKVMQEGDRIIGYGADRVHMMLTRAGVPFSMEILPWARAYALALNNPDTCVFSTGRTPAREALFKWVVPTVSTDYVLYGLASRHWQIKSLEEVVPYRVGSYIGDVRGDYLRGRKIQVEDERDDLNNPRKLLLGRIDFWATNTRMAQVVLKSHAWERQIVSVLVFNKVDLYLACNPTVSDEVVEKIRRAAGSMLQDGSFDKLAHQYDGWTLPSATP